MEGSALSTCLPLSSDKARTWNYRWKGPPRQEETKKEKKILQVFSHIQTLPKASPQTTTSPFFNVPFCTMKEATGPLDLSRPASITVPLAFLCGLALSSCNFNDKP